MLNKIDEDEKVISPLHYSGQVREMWFLTEDGLYEVLMQSRKPIAKDLGYAIQSKAVNTHCKGVSKMEVPTNGGIQERYYLIQDTLESA